MIQILFWFSYFTAGPQVGAVAGGVVGMFYFCINDNVSFILFVSVKRTTHISTLKIFLIIPFEKNFNKTNVYSNSLVYQSACPAKKIVRPLRLLQPL